MKNNKNIFEFRQQELVYQLSKMADEQDPSCTPVYYVGGSEVNIVLK